MKKILLIIAILMVVIVGWMLLRGKGDTVVDVSTPTATVSPTETPTPVVTNNTSPTATPVSKNVITYTDSGYTPSTITIKKGETVTWKNESGIKMWTASAVHPTHKVYPGTDIALCTALRPIAMFDSCAGMTTGQSWSFKFDNVGTWKYHNHLNSSKFGTVVVE